MEGRRFFRLLPFRLFYTMEESFFMKKAFCAVLIMALLLSPFAGCSAETEASFQTILFLAQKVDELGLPAVLTIENPKTRIAETVVNATQNKNQTILSLNSMQGVTAQEVKDGAAYLSLMESNLIVLRDALN